MKSAIIIVKSEFDRIFKNFSRASKTGSVKEKKKAERNLTIQLDYLSTSLKAFKR